MQPLQEPSAPQLTLHDLPDELLLLVFDGFGLEARCELHVPASSPAATIGAPRRGTTRSCTCRSLRDLAPVCRRWRALVNSPHFLRELLVSIRSWGWSWSAGEDDEEQGLKEERRFMRHAHSFCEWLAAQAAGHVQQLHVILSPPTGLSARSGDEVSASIAAALAVCGTKGGLSSIDLSIGALPLSFGSWMAPLGRSLRRLIVEADEIAFDSSVASLTACNIWS